MGDVLWVDRKCKNPERRPISIEDIGPMRGGEPAEWSGEVDEIGRHISGSMNDWLNRGSLRARKKLDEKSGGAEI